MVPEPESRPPEGAAVPSAASRLVWIVLALALGFLMLGFLADGARDLLARAALPTGTAEWIWAEVPASRSRGLAFYAVRDVDLGRAPPAAARLLIAAEEEYRVWWNGRPVGEGAHRPGAPVDAYRMDEFLMPGPNRMVVLVRSGRGQGGLLAALVPAVVSEVPDTSAVAIGEWGEPLLVTDESWQIVRQERPGLVEGWLPVVRRERRGGGEVWPPEGFQSVVGSAPRVWGLPPVGRWGWPRAPEEARTPVDPRPPRTLWSAEHNPAGPQRVVRFALGSPVEGFLALELAPMDPADPDERPGAPPAALVAVGTTPPDLAAGGAASALAVTPDDALSWQDVTPRRFAHVEIVSTRPVVAVTVSPRPAPASVASVASEDAEERRLFALGEERPGLFGIRTVPSRPPLEKQLRRQLQEVAGGGGG